MTNEEIQNLLSKKPIEIAGTIATNFIHLENIVNHHIYKFFSPREKEIFLQVLLDSQVIPVGGKIKVLKAMKLDNKIIDAFSKCSRIRNLLAHNLIDDKPEVEVYNITSTTFDSKITYNPKVSMINNNGEIKEYELSERLKTYFKNEKIVIQGFKKIES